MPYHCADLLATLDALAALMSAERDPLCRLDGVIGDADHGLAMEGGMAAAAAAARAAASGDTAGFRDLFNAAASGFLNAVGASSGPLYATAFLRAGKAAEAATTGATLDPDGLRGLIIAMCEGIAQRGKAEPGQKTMLDAWHPAAEAARAGAAFEEIAAAARAGAEATAAMTATLGRAARLGERSLGHADPGAVSAAMIISRLCQAFEDRTGKSG